MSVFLCYVFCLFSSPKGHKTHLSWEHKFGNSSRTHFQTIGPRVARIDLQWSYQASCWHSPLFIFFSYPHAYFLVLKPCQQFTFFSNSVLILQVNPNMVNRPLPAIPKGTNHQNGHIVKTKNWTSLDDDVLTPQHRVQMRRDNMKDSPRRRQPRPHSEVFSDHKFVELDGPGCYMYGSRTQVHQQVSRSRSSEGQQHRIQQYSQQLQMQYQAGPPSSHMMKYQNGDPLQEEGLYEYADDSAFCDKNRPG